MRSRISRERNRTRQLVLFYFQPVAFDNFPQICYNITMKVVPYKKHLEKLQQWIEDHHGTDVILRRRKSGTVAGCFIDMSHVAKRLMKSAGIAKAIKAGTIALDNWKPLIVVMYPKHTSSALKLAILIHELGHKVLKHRDVHLKSKRKLNRVEQDAWVAGYDEAAQAIPNLWQVAGNTWLFRQMDNIEKQFDGALPNSGELIEEERDAIIMSMVGNYLKEWDRINELNNAKN